jgi:hypothetical protein
LDDLVQSHPSVDGKPLRNALIRFSGLSSPHGGVSWDIRLGFIHRRAARHSLAKVLAWDFDNLIIAHGPNLHGGARPFVERAFRWLRRPYL